MKNQRLIQFAASFLIVLSLFVSSISAACTCTHEAAAVMGEHCQNQIETKTEEHAAHQHSYDIENADAHHYDNKTGSPEIASIAEDGCCCAVQPAPRAVAKAENVKIEKQQAAILSPTPVEIVLTHQIVSVKDAEFVTPFYLSDSFHNLTPGRAPPRL